MVSNNSNNNTPSISGSSTVSGSDKNDALVGTSAADMMYGGNGADTLSAGAGDDTLDGGDANDSLSGEAGDDSLYGGNSSDYLDGGVGSDLLDGGDGNDSLYGGAGNDTLDGGQSSDVLDGGDGNDSIEGGDGNDSIEGGDGSDWIDGGASQDSIQGGGGDDWIDAGEGDDTVDGGAGDDTITGGLGNDTLYGGSGDDFIDGGDTSSNKSVDHLYGGAGDDTLVGNGNQDELDGGSGDDVFAITSDGSNFNNITVYGGSGYNVLDLSQYYADYPDLQVIYEYESDDERSGTILLKSSTNGQELGRIYYSDIDKIQKTAPAICFAPGTLIATIRGEVPVEELKQGDRVITRDNGIQQVSWTGRRVLNRNELRIAPHLQPVLIRAGALGYGLPARDLIVSPNHRILIRSDRAEMLYAENEVLIAAKHLVGMPGVERLNKADVVYHHVLFAQHEVILGNGSWSESFLPGEYSMRGLQSEQRDELYYLFPELRNHAKLMSLQAARRSLKRHEVAVLRAGGHFLFSEEASNANAPIPRVYRGH